MWIYLQPKPSVCHLTTVVRRVPWTHHRPRFVSVTRGIDSIMTESRVIVSHKLYFTANRKAIIGFFVYVIFGAYCCHCHIHVYQDSKAWIIKSPTHCPKTFFYHKISVGNQSPISRRPTAKPSCNSSAIVMKFGRREVAEQLQCMSDWGLKQSHVQNFTSKCQSM